VRREIAVAVASCLAGALLLWGDQPWDVVALAGVVAIAATRGWSRALVGVVLVAVGLADLPRGALLAATGVLVAVRGPRWPALGARYEAPGPMSERDAWDALDRGEDPTTMPE
jgi:hypothetical protein